MNFCKKCGLQIEEGLNFCPSCGEAIHANSGTPEMPDSIQNAPDSTPYVPNATSDEPAPTQYASAPTPYVSDSTSEMPYPPPNPSSDIPPPMPAYTPQYQAPPQKNALVADSLSSIAKTFTANPEDGAATVVTAKSPAWAVIGALYVLLYTFATYMLYYAIIRGFGFGFDGQVVLQGLLIGILYFVGLACCVKIIFTIFKINVSFLKAITIVAGCSIMVSVIMVAVIIMSLVSLWVAQLLMTISTVVFHIMVYSFIKSTAEFKKSPLWVYLGLITALSIVQQIIVNNVLN